MQVPEVIERQLSVGEQVLWYGRPRQGLVLRAGDAFFIPFTLLWCATVLNGARAAIARDHVAAFPLIYLPFALVALYLLVGRFVLDIERRSTTDYAVTRDRILIVSHGFRKAVTSLPLATLADITLSTTASGAGSIVFGRDGFSWMNDPAFGTRGQAAPRFELIADAEAVHALIRETQRRKEAKRAL